MNKNIIMIISVHDKIFKNDFLKLVGDECGTNFNIYRTNWHSPKFIFTEIVKTEIWVYTHRAGNVNS